MIFYVLCCVTLSLYALQFYTFQATNQWAVSSVQNETVDCFFMHHIDSSCTTKKCIIKSKSYISLLSINLWMCAYNTCAYLVIFWYTIIKFHLDVSLSNAALYSDWKFHVRPCHIYWSICFELNKYIYGWMYFVYIFFSLYDSYFKRVVIFVQLSCNI